MSLYDYDGLHSHSRFDSLVKGPEMKLVNAIVELVIDCCEGRGVGPDVADALLRSAGTDNVVQEFGGLAAPMGGG